MHAAIKAGADFHVRKGDLAAQHTAARAQQLTQPRLLDSVTTVPLQHLSQQQRHARQAVQEALRNAQDAITHGPGSASAEPRIIALQGGPGCGKSALTQLIVDDLVEDGTAVLVTATTATAARRLGLRPADTAHAALQLPIHGGMPPLRALDAKTLALHKAHLVVCDEFSMLTSQTLHKMTYRLAQATDPGKPPKVLLLVGDLAQLPPICRHGRRGGGQRRRHTDVPREPTLCAHCHLSKCPIYNKDTTNTTTPTNITNTITKIDLTRVYRQATDPQYADFLDHIRHSRPDHALLGRVLGHCFRPNHDLIDLLDDTTVVLCSHNRDVRIHNNTALLWHRDHGNLQGPVYDVAMDSNANEASQEARHAAQAWLYRPNFHLLKRVAQGCKVIYTTTTNKQTGATNSATGTVVEVLLADTPPDTCPPAHQHKPWVKALRIQLHDTGKTVRVTRTRVASQTTHGHTFTKKTFPVMLAYAMTAHRCQGATLTGRTILHVREAFSPAMVYVMLSRVTTRDNLLVLGTLLPEHFTSISMATYATHAQQPDTPDDDTDSCDTSEEPGDHTDTDI